MIKFSLKSLLILLLMIPARLFSQQDSVISIEVIVSEEELHNGIYESVECDVVAEFPGGEKSMKEYIGKTIQFPYDLNIEATVYVKMAVTKDGSIKLARIIRGVDELLDNEALRVVNSFPNWFPAKKNGNLVDSWVLVPVKFKHK